MAPSIKVVCPSCGSGLKVTKPSLIGKRVTCPSCDKPFLIEMSPDQARELAGNIGEKSGQSAPVAPPAPGTRSTAEYDTINPLEVGRGKSSEKSTATVRAAQQAT